MAGYTADKYTAKRRVEVSAFDFESAPRFRAVLTFAKESVVTARGGEKAIDGYHDKGKLVEYEAAARPDDKIVTYAEKEGRHLIRAREFSSWYETDPNNHDQYRSRSVGHAVRVTENIVFRGYLGEDDWVKAGGVAFFNESYPRRFGPPVVGYQQDFFKDHFAREAKDGSLMPLTRPLPVQLVWAQEKGETAHINDIEELMRNGTNATFAADQNLPRPTIAG